MVQARALTSVLTPICQFTTRFSKVENAPVISATGKAAAPGKMVR